MAKLLAPAADWLSLTPAGRSVFFAGSRNLPWQLTSRDAEVLLVGYADSPAYEAANWASMGKPLKPDTVLLEMKWADSYIGPPGLSMSQAPPGPLCRSRWA